MIYNNIRETIGKTPTIHYHTINQSKIYLKLEMFNPGGSVKDRIALEMIEALWRDGIINENSTVVEATSGNTGIGLALVLASYGLRFVAIMPDNMSKERIDLMKAYGAEILLTPAAKGIAYSKELAIELANTKGYVYLDQFSNPNNPVAHMRTTANELLADFPQGIDYLVAGIGTGGSITGLSRILKKQFPMMRSIAVEPFESAVLSGEPKGPHMIPGIGAGFVPVNYDASLVDGIIKIKSEDARKKVNLLAKKGLFLGVSSGAAILAAEELAEKHPGKVIVTIAPDGGIKYMSLGIYGL